MLFIPLAALLLVALFWVATPDSSSSGSEAVSSNGDDSASSVKDQLVADPASYDFGTISMATGRVSKTFSVTNTSTEPVVVQKLYSSCMCTTASITSADGYEGPFGMPGHGVVPRINLTIAPGETASVDVTFDPAAHGPAGVGRIARLVTLETENGTLALNIAAQVTP